MHALLEWSGYEGASRRQVSTVEILAKVAGIEVTQFVRDHTMLPLRRAILPYAEEVPHGSTKKGSVLWTMALRDIRPGAYFCSMCVDEDQEFHGTPYWRREHQLPGLYWCAKHGCPLNHVESRNAFSLSPADFTDGQLITTPSDAPSTSLSANGPDWMGHLARLGARECSQDMYLFHDPVL